MKDTLALAAALALAASLDAQTYATAPAGDGCGGATLTVTFTPTGNAGNQRLQVRAEGLHPRNAGTMIFGTTQVAIGPVLDPGCFVRTDAIWSTHFQTDATGTQVWERSWPASALGFYYIQLGSLDLNTLEVRLTNCVLASHF